LDIPYADQNRPPTQRAVAEPANVATIRVLT
jgi:hypothetical protein